MPLALHLLRRDLRRFRVLIAAWLLLVAALAAFDGITPLVVRSIDAALAVGTTRSLLWTAVQLVGMLIVTRTIHADPATGSDAFWMTRPIGSRSLLASKLTLLVTVFVGAPLLADLVLMAAYHVPVPSMFRASLQTILFRTLWLLALASIASLTANLAQFMAVGAATMAAYSVAMTAMAMYARARSTSFSTALIMQAGTPELPFRAPDPTGDVVLLALAIVAAFTMSATQYRTRLRSRSVPAGAAALCLAYAGASVWEWPILRPFEEPPAWAMSESAVQMHAADAIALSRTGGESSNGRNIQVVGQGRLWLSDLEAGWIPDVRLMGATFTLDNGRTIRSSGFWYGEPSPVDPEYRPPLSEAARQVLQVRAVAIPDSSEARPPTMLFLRDVDTTRDTGATGTYDGRFQVDLLQCQVVGTLPLGAGVVFQDRSYRLAIDDVTSDLGDAVTLRGRESDVHSYFDRQPARSYWFYLRNTTASEGMTGLSQPFEGGHMSFALPVPSSIALPLFSALHRFPSPFDAHGVAIRFPPSHIVLDETDERSAASLRQPYDDDSTPEGRSKVTPQRFVPTAAWIAGSELVILRVTRHGSVTRTLHIPRVQLERRD